jgi:hypothetical protein
MSLRHEWGSGHAIFHKELFRKLIYFYSEHIQFHKPHSWDGEELILAKVYSSKFYNNDYHGHVDIILDEEGLRFKRDADV